jgi:hypothetical protein
MLQVEPVGNDSLTVDGRMRKMFFIDRSILARLTFCFGPKPSCGEDSFVGECFPLLIIKTAWNNEQFSYVAKISPPIAVRPTIVNFSARSVRSLSSDLPGHQLRLAPPPFDLQTPLQTQR